MELQEQDSKAFEEIVSILQCHPEIEKFELAKEPILSLPGLEIYPSKRKVFRDRQEIQLTTKEYEILLLLDTHEGMCLLTISIYENVWEITRLVVKTTPSAFTSAIYGRSCMRQLPMPLLPSDPSGKSDIALKYKQRNKSQQSDPLRLLFFFF